MFMDLLTLLFLAIPIGAVIIVVYRKSTERKKANQLEFQRRQLQNEIQMKKQKEERAVSIER